jgi:hypothetical protein
MREALLEGRERGELSAAEGQASEGPVSAPASDGRAATELRGIPRKLDSDLIRRQMQAGTLATNAAAFWSRE